MLLERLVAGGRPPDPGLQHPARGLAGPETGDPELPGELGERFVDGLLDLCFLHFDRELDLVALQWSYLGFHMRSGAYCADGGLERRDQPGGAGPPGPVEDGSG